MKNRKKVVSSERFVKTTGGAIRKTKTAWYRCTLECGHMEERVKAFSEAPTHLKCNSGCE